MDEPVVDKGDLLDLDAYRACRRHADDGAADSTFVNFRWVAVRHRNGNTTARRQCNECGYVSSFQAPISRVPTAPLVVDAALAGVECERCGSKDGIESHHWAPSAIFGSDSHNWPTSWLCPPCHRAWHQRMRDAGLRDGLGGVD